MCSFYVIDKEDCIRDKFYQIIFFVFHFQHYSNRDTNNDMNKKSTVYVKASKAIKALECKTNFLKYV